MDYDFCAQSSQGADDAKKKLVASLAGRMAALNCNGNLFDDMFPSYVRNVPRAYWDRYNNKLACDKHCSIKIIISDSQNKLKLFPKNSTWCCFDTKSGKRMAPFLHARW